MIIKNYNSELLVTFDADCIRVHDFAYCTTVPSFGLAWAGVT